MLFGFASAQVPTAMFNGMPVSGIAPLTVTFTDQSMGNPASWAWYFGDENYTVPWTQMNASAGWSVRRSHSSVVMPDGSIVLMGGRAGESTFRNDVWRSMDNGATWVLVNATPGWSARYSHSSVVMPDGSIILMGGMTGVLMNDVWRSPDNGTTWTEITPSAEWSARAHHSTVVLPDGSIVLMGGTESGAYMNDAWRSTDNGTTWTEMTLSAGWSPRCAHSSVAMPDGSIVLMGGVDASGNRNDVWRSTDNGTTWTGMTPGAGWSARQALSSVAMPDGSIVLMGGSLSVGSFENDVWQSWDNGATWTEIPNAGWSARCYHTSVAMPDGSIVLVGGGSNISDKNDVWRFQSAGSSAQNPSHTYTRQGIYQVTLQVFNEDGYNSTRKTGYITVNAPPQAPVADFSGTPGSGQAPLTVSFTDQSTGSPTGWAWYFGDENYTAPWTLVNASAGWLGRGGHSSVVMPDSSIVLMGGSKGSIPDTYNDTWRSKDNGATWTLMNASSGWTARYGHTSVVMPDSTIVLMGGIDRDYHLKNDVWRSGDYGATWTLVNASAGWEPRDQHSSVAMLDGTIVLMGGHAGHLKNDVWKSTDTGATWTRVNGSAGWIEREAHSSVAMPDGSIVLMGGWNSFTEGFKNDTWRSTDDGATWTQVNGRAGWSGRIAHSSLAMPDGSIVLMGGWNGCYKDDVWRSTDNGATWTQVNVSAGWTARYHQSNVVMPDGSITLMGGWDPSDKNDVWRFQPSGSSAQNPWHTYTTPGTYQVTLQISNADGYNSTRKAHYITVRDNEGSDSGGDFPPQITPTPTTTFIGKTITETVNVGGGSAVTRAEMTGTNLGKNLVITAFPRNSLLSNIAEPQTTVYQYITIVSSTIPGVVNKTTLEFSVPQSWLTEHGFNAGDIVMMHYDNGQWQELDTRYVSQKSGNVFYQATTPGFSYFAIVYQKNGTDMGDFTPVTTTVPAQVSTLKAPVQEAPSPVEITREKTQAVPPAPVTQPSRGIPMTTIIVGTTGAIATIIGTVLIRGWWIRKQNPTLFRKNDRY
jgi:PGF-pre-PGF domain-containing protein